MIEESNFNSNPKRKYNNIQDYMNGPTLIQRSDAKEIENIDEDRGYMKDNEIINKYFLIFSEFSS